MLISFTLGLKYINCKIYILFSMDNERMIVWHLVFVLLYFVEGVMVFYKIKFYNQSKIQSHVPFHKVVGYIIFWSVCLPLYYFGLEKL